MRKTGGNFDKTVGEGHYRTALKNCRKLREKELHVGRIGNLDSAIICKEEKPRRNLFHSVKRITGSVEAEWGGAGKQKGEGVGEKQFNAPLVEP